MSKFCTKCGATLDDNAAFCTTCGAKFDVAPAAEKADDNATILDKFKANANAEGIKKLQANPNFKKYVGIGVVAIAAIIIICILCSVLGGGWKKPVEKYFKSIVKEDGALMMEAYHEYDIKDEKKTLYDNSASAQKKAYKNEVKNMNKYLDEVGEYGKDIKISVKIEEKEELDEDELKDIEKIIEKSWDKKRLEVTKGYTVEGITKIKGDDDKGEEEFEAIVLKVDGDWCLYSMSWDAYGSFDLGDLEDLGDLGDLEDLGDIMGSLDAFM